MTNKELLSKGGRTIVATPTAPQALGPYSQAVRVDNVVYISGQIPLVPDTMVLIEGDIKLQAEQVFKNLLAVAEAAGGDLSDCVKLNISVTDLNGFDQVNAVMSQYFSSPYPARACVEVAALPKSALIEVDAILVLG